MRKREILHSATLWMLFFANTVYAVKYGASWLYTVCTALMACVLALDVWEVVRNGRKR